MKRATLVPAVLLAATATTLHAHRVLDTVGATYGSLVFEDDSVIDSAIGGPPDGPALLSAAKAFGKDKKGDLQFKVVNGLTFDSNPFSTSVEREDWRWDGGVQATYVHQVSDNVVASAFGGVSMRRHFDFSALDSDALTVGAKGTVGLSETIAASLTYGSTWIYSPFFEDNGLTLQTITLAAAIKIPVKDENLSLTVSPAVSRTFAHPDDYDNWAFGVKVSGSYKVSEKLSVGAGVSVSYATYDSYFGMDRNGWQIAAEAGLSYAICDCATAALGVSYRWSENDLPLFDYDQFMFGPSVTVTF